MGVSKVRALLFLFVCTTHELSFLPEAEKYVSTNVIKSIYTSPAQRADKCREWYADDRGVDHLSLPHCPSTEQQLKMQQQQTNNNGDHSATFSEDKAPPRLHHPGADRCYRSGGGFWTTVWHLVRHWSDPGGQQCCYSNGTLLTDGPGAGTADRGAFLWNHWWHDVLPSYYCCMDGNVTTCRLYLEKRPTDTGPKSNDERGEKRAQKEH